MLLRAGVPHPPPRRPATHQIELALYILLMLQTVFRQDNPSGAATYVLAIGFCLCFIHIGQLYVLQLNPSARITCTAIKFHGNLCR